MVAHRNVKRKKNQRRRRGGNTVENPEKKKKERRGDFAGEGEKRWFSCLGEGEKHRMVGCKTTVLCARSRRPERIPLGGKKKAENLGLLNLEGRQEIRVLAGQECLETQ